MKIKTLKQVKGVFLLTVLAVLFSVSKSYSQTAKDLETDFVNLRKFCVSIGTVVNYNDTVKGQISTKKRFIPIGSGLMTYVKVKDTLIVNAVVTAKHVVKFFENKNIPIWIRPTWADTIKTNEYFGISIPLANPDKSKNVYEYPNVKIDLGCVVLLPAYYDKLFFDKSKVNNNPTFPFNSMTAPYVGNQVWILGYPSHVENYLKDYAICVVKPGYVAWRPDENSHNTDLNHITLIESNASYGNSGGPVFSLQEHIELIGIMTSGYPEQDNVLLNGKPIIDTSTKSNMIVEVRSGVSIVEKAENVKRMISYVNEEIKKYITNAQIKK